MKPTLLLVLSLLSLPAVQGGEQQAYLGVWLDPHPLPPLLAKHLGLKPGQGIRVSNIHRESPADKAGLERDDLIIKLGRKAVRQTPEFAEAIAQRTVGSTIQLTVIQQGAPKTLSITLKARPTRFDPKYDPEPSASRIVRPGRIFRKPPGQDHWTEVPKNLKDSHRLPRHPLFEDRYVFMYHHDQGFCLVTIQGDPNDEGTTVTVQQNGREYQATVGTLDELPPEVRHYADRGLEQAITHNRHTPWWKRTPPQHNDPNLPAEPNPVRDYLKKHHFEVSPPIDPRIDALERDLEILQERIKQLEKERSHPPAKI